MHARSRRSLLFAALSLITVLFAGACASVEKPQPVDPVKEQITILQKQLLELQNVQNETKKKVEEQASTIEALNAKVNTLEEKQVAPPPRTQPALESRPTPTVKAVPAKKKPVKQPAKKKKKQPRRKAQR